MSDLDYLTKMWKNHALSFAEAELMIKEQYNRIAQLEARLQGAELASRFTGQIHKKMNKQIEEDQEVIQELGLAVVRAARDEDLYEWHLQVPYEEFEEDEDTQTAESIAEEKEIANEIIQQIREKIIAKNSKEFIEWVMENYDEALRKLADE